MKEISFLLFKRDIFDPLPPEIPTLFIGFEDDDAYSFTKKVQEKNFFSCPMSLWYFTFSIFVAFFVLLFVKWCKK